MVRAAGGADLPPTNGPSSTTIAFLRARRATNPRGTSNRQPAASTTPHSSSTSWMAGSPVSAPTTPAPRGAGAAMVWGTYTSTAPGSRLHKQPAQADYWFTKGYAGRPGAAIDAHQPVDRASAPTWVCRSD